MRSELFQTRLCIQTMPRIDATVYTASTLWTQAIEFAMWIQYYHTTAPRTATRRQMARPPRLAVRLSFKLSGVVKAIKICSLGDRRQRRCAASVEPWVRAGERF